LSCLSITGYSGGGKKLIERYEGSNPVKPGLESPNMYALGLAHKHIPEMKKTCGLEHAPIFTPIVSNFYKGMTVSVPIHASLFSRKVTPSDVCDFLTGYYQGSRFIKVMPFGSDACLDEGFLNATACNDTNNAEIFVFGNTEQILLTTRLDNLGKGASGAAVQNMNLMLGFDEGAGL
ncbi:MAG: N-acetyl-gamma-glutamyl-phosphate reductase, partial [Clostridiales bacterium]|nr:N-acetyl-gamma-glutamyl-phosphate reductase [Clostridiales bacterium]